MSEHVEQAKGLAFTPKHFHHVSITITSPSFLSTGCSFQSPALKKAMSLYCGVVSALPHAALLQASKHLCRPFRLPPPRIPSWLPSSLKGYCNPFVMRQLSHESSSSLLLHLLLLLSLSLSLSLSLLFFSKKWRDRSPSTVLTFVFQILIACDCPLRLPLRFLFFFFFLYPKKTLLISKD